MAECMRTFLKKDGTVVPCNKCPNCVARKVSEWSFRLMQEFRVSDTANFITLTYDTTHIPITPTGRFSLSRVKTSASKTGADDLRLFFKRLRKRHTGRRIKTIKYFAVGEYGGRTRRPHYHIILFNADKELIQPAWDKGMVHYGDERGVCEASVGYCLKYISKTCKIGLSKHDDRIPSFARCSKGLGVNYLTESMLSWHHGDVYNRMYCNLVDGRKISMPRYYKLKLYSDNLRRNVADYAYLQTLARKGGETLPREYHKEYLSRKAAIIQSFSLMAQAALKTKI